MGKGSYKKTPIRMSRERGIYNKEDWLKESGLHLESAKMLRHCSAEKKPLISTLMKSQDRSNVNAEIHLLIVQREAGNKSSILLLAYAFEMLLKAGVVCLYSDVPREAFSRDLKKKYRHELRMMACEIEAPLAGDELDKLDLLSKWMIDHARYPVTPMDEMSYSSQWNELIREFWDDARFEQFISLYEKLSTHIMEIDACSNDPKVSRRWWIDDDGYVIYRIGGKLKDRLVVHYSSEQKKRGDDNRESLRSLMLKYVSDPTFKIYFAGDWNAIEYREIE